MVLSSTRARSELLYQVKILFILHNILCVKNIRCKIVNVKFCKVYQINSN